MITCQLQECFIISIILPKQLFISSLRLKFLEKYNVGKKNILLSYIVACQRGGVFNKLPWLQAATKHGARDPLVRYKYGPITGPVLLRQGEPGTSQYTYTHSKYYTLQNHWQKHTFLGTTLHN